MKTATAGTRPTLLEQVLIFSAVYILDKKSPPATVVVDGVKQDVELALTRGKRPDRHAELACEELRNAVPIGILRPTVGEIAQHLYVMNHRREQFGPLHRSEAPATPTSFDPRVEVRRIEARGPAAEPISSELQKLRAEIAAKRDLDPPRTIAGSTIDVLHQVVRHVAEQRPIADRVVVIEQTWDPELGLFQTKRREDGTVKFLENLKDDRRPCPFEPVGLPVTFVGVGKPHVGLIASAALDEALRIGAL